MKKTLKQYKFLIIGFLLVYSLTIFATTYKVDYSMTAPGYNDYVDSTLYIPTEYSVGGSFHTTSVISIDEISYYQYILGGMMKKVDIEDLPSYYDNVQDSNLSIMYTLMKDDSLQTSIIVGAKDLEGIITYTSYPTIYLVYNHMTADTLKVGDSILSVDGNADIITVLTEAVCDQTVTVSIIRDGIDLDYDITKNEIDDTCSFGIYIGTYSEIVDTELDYTIYNTNTGGPSGGLLQSLYVYNQLTEFDYTLGLKVAGTGTVDVDGNVGYIGGVRQKIITAIDNDIDIFFVPYLNDEDTDNYIEALLALEEFDSDMILVGVSSFNEALLYLESYGDTNE